MTKQLIVAVMCGYLGMSTINAQESKPVPEPQRLVELRARFERESAAALRPVLVNYQRDLASLLRTLTQAGDLEGALTVKREMSAVESGTARTRAPTVMKYKPADGWVDTGITISKGQRITIRAQGTYSPDNGRNVCDANGLNLAAWAPYRYAKDVNGGALLAYISEAETTYYAIGTHKEIVAKDRGRLFIGVNDTILSDDRGELDVTITY